MKQIKLLVLFALCLLASAVTAQELENGVSKSLATERTGYIRGVNYELEFNIPEDPQSSVTGQVVISFNLNELRDVVLDFQGECNTRCIINGKKSECTISQEHIILPMKRLIVGANRVALSFTSLDRALNRHKDYMYTLFVPDKARSCFPCFDQPDLRATFKTQLNVPEGWKTMTSDSSNPIPTYLYSFVAGNYQEKADTIQGRPLRALYLEQDPQKTAQLDKIMEEAAQALRWMEGYTGIAYPFSEYGMVILPGYQFGGMEHPGAVQLTDRRIFLGQNPSQEQELSRLELIAHETAHMWFGDMVSLKWFEDVWTNEVIANFMASKITRRQYTGVDHDLNFIRTYQTRAVAIDRTEGTHPIAQPLDNLNCASLLYDNIIYDKAPVMMRMLEQIVGADRLQKGLQQYLKKYYFNNASWDDMIAELHQVAPDTDIKQFSEVWVKQKGMPTIHTTYQNGQLIVTQKDPYNRGICWRQKFQVRLLYDMEPSRTVTINMQQPTYVMNIKEPAYIIPNYDGQGYGRFTLDETYTQRLPLRVITTRSDLARYALLLTLYDNYLMGRIPANYFGELHRAMMTERNPLIMQTCLDQMHHIAIDQHIEERKTLELCMLDLLAQNPSAEFRRAMFREMAGGETLSPNVIEQLYSTWSSQSDPLLNEHDYMDMAYWLAIVKPDQWQQILDTQRERLNTDLLRQEFDYVSQACTPDVEKQRELFNRLLQPENRQREPWALQALSLLSSEVREPANLEFITASLESLEYIQQTSDIFFPGNWMKSLLSDHQSPEALRLVKQFLDEHPSFPHYLRNKVLEAAWPLANHRK